MRSVTIEQAFVIAFERHQAGHLEEAERLYRQILSRQPQHAESIHHLGLIAHQMGHHAMAVELIGRAIAVRPDYAEAYHNLGSSLQRQGRRVEAIAAYRQAIALNRKLPETHNNLGNALREEGCLDDSIDVLRQAIALRADYAEAHHNLGVALNGVGMLDEAISAWRRAIELQPGDPTFHQMLGDALRENGQFDEAIRAYRAAVAVRPHYAAAHHNLGLALKETGKWDEAVAAYHRAIACDPNFAEPHNNLGVLLTEIGRLDEAIAACRRAIELRPHFAAAHGNLGNALKSKGQLDEAIDAYRQAIALSADPAGGYNNLGVALQERGQLDEAMSAYQQALALRPDVAHFGSNLVFCMLHSAAHDAVATAEEHRRWSRRHAESLPRSVQPFSNQRRTAVRLRIGYVSPDFRDHPVGRFLLPLLAHHDTGAFEIFCYSNRRKSDAVTERLRAAANHWREIEGLSDQRAADQIRADGIDILVDLAGHTLGNRLLIFARKPAPVQVTYLGYPGTTGLSAIDYRLTDGFADPPGLTERFHSEKLQRLPQTSWCFAETANVSAVAPPPLVRNGFVTFGSFNSFGKVTAPMLEGWGEILREVPRSRLLLKAAALGSASARDRVRGMLLAQGIEVDRLDLRGLQPDHATHLALYREMDIALDTFPYHGTTTTCEALWMGVPVITLAGQTHISRVGLSLLSNIGLQSLVAHTPDEYVRLAAALAEDHDRVKALRFGLRERVRTSPLMDAPQFARNVEAAYRQMWRAWCEAPCTGNRQEAATHEP
jgi:protein O-GlcNAc transferase